MQQTVCTAMHRFALGITFIILYRKRAIETSKEENIAKRPRISAGARVLDKVCRVFSAAIKKDQIMYAPAAIV